MVDLLDAAAAGDRRALARLLTLAETGGDAADAIVTEAYARGNTAHLVGITGPPGAGKSTLTAALGVELRQRGATVAILAIDPSSPETGGALLGDRIRMGALLGDAGAFVRSMAARSAPGGLADAASASLSVLAIVGFDFVLLETVGAGQGEVDVAAEADTTVVVLAPGLGDDIQALKAGILEVGDVLVVNKADRDGADRLVAELAFVASLPVPAGNTADETWTVPILHTTATTGAGVPVLLDALSQHRRWLGTTSAGAELQRRRAGRRILALAARRITRRLTATVEKTGILAELSEAVASRRLSPPEAAGRLLEAAAAASGATSRVAPGASAK